MEVVHTREVRPKDLNGLYKGDTFKLATNEDKVYLVLGPDGNDVLCVCLNNGDKNSFVKTKSVFPVRTKLIVDGFI